MHFFTRLLRWLLLSVALLTIVFVNRTERATHHLLTGCPDQSAETQAFCLSVDGETSAVLVELQTSPASVYANLVEQTTGDRPSFANLSDYAIDLVAQQDAFLAELQTQGISTLLRREDVIELDNSLRTVEFRFTYLRNGMVLFIPTEQIAALQAHPQVVTVDVFQPVSIMLDKAIDYSLGTASSISARRTAVYGAMQELTPAGALNHPEAPDMVTDDGVEGQGMIIAVIDTGVDYRHPTFGGTGQTTPLPRLSGNAATPTDNQKVIYNYAFSNDTPYVDDFGHGTHVAADAAGYLVDGNTPPNLGYGSGYDGLGTGPTPGGVSLHGTAPQAQIMAYKVCGIAGSCLGATSLSIEDAVSPYVLSSDGSPTAFPKPVADVINLSLGSSAGDADNDTSVASNNAALMGTIVVASAGNSGPGPGTIGAPSAATLAISVGASLDPGSITGGDVLAASEVTDSRADDSAGPAPETGAASEANVIAAGERNGMKLFSVSGGGALPDGSVSAFVTYVDLRDDAAAVPPEVANRIALVEFTGTFGGAANTVASGNPAAILLITSVESATAVAVVNGIPTYTIGPADGEYLKTLFTSYVGDPNVAGTVTEGDISTLPIRLSDGVSLPTYQPAMASFSSRGPNDHPDANYRVIKPDVTAPGVSILAPATVDGNATAVAMANPEGYIMANGTSFSGPIAAGAMVLIRQHVRDYLGFDAPMVEGDDYTAQIYADRFEAVTLSRALLMNSATNLRSGMGVPDSDTNSRASINDQGAGHIDIAGALDVDAVMLAPTLLLNDGGGAEPDEYTAGVGVTAGDSGNHYEVMLPSASFGNLEIAKVQGNITVLREVVLRDIITSAASGLAAGRNGAGTYDLSFADNRKLVNSNTQVNFTSDAAGNNPITSVTVPENGTATFYVKVVADGNGLPISGTEVMWYIYATQQGSGKQVRMPFYYRAITPATLKLDAPIQNDITDTEGITGTLPLDENGEFTLNWTHDVPDATHATPVGFRIEHATFEEQVFLDEADEALVNGENSQWVGSAQWTTQPDPNSADNAYFIASAANQNESLTMVAPVVLPAGGALLTFDTNIKIEEGYDFGQVQASADNGNFSTIATLDVDQDGLVEIDITPFADGNLWLRFVLVTDLGPGGSTTEIGWYVDNIAISVNNYVFVKNVDTTEVRLTTHAADIMQSGEGDEHLYRIAGIFEPLDPALLGTIVGPYSNAKTVVINSPAPTQVGLSQIASVTSSSLWGGILLAVLAGMTLIAVRRYRAD